MLFVEERMPGNKYLIDNTKLGNGTMQNKVLYKNKVKASIITGKLTENPDEKL